MELSFTDPNASHPTPSTNSKFAQVEAWTHVCPDLWTITFFDGSTLVRGEDSDLSWKFFGQ